MSGHETEQMSLVKSAREPGTIRPSAVLSALPCSPALLWGSPAFWADGGENVCIPPVGSAVLSLPKSAAAGAV